MTRHLIVHPGVVLTAGNLNDYVQLQSGAGINLTGGVVTKNIWGPGNTSICGDVSINADLGVAPPGHLLQGCPVVHVTSNMAV